MFAIIKRHTENGVVMDYRIVAAIESFVIFALLLINFIFHMRNSRKLEKYIESRVYDTKSAKDNTLMSFPLPIAAFRLEDSCIVWANDYFYDMCGEIGSRLDACLNDILPEFSTKWLSEGQTVYPEILELNGKKYRIHGNLVRPSDGDGSDAFMGITYWIDITEYDDIRLEYENTRPVTCIAVIDNLDELTKNQPDRVINDIRENVEDMLSEWADEFRGIIRRYSRDRYICFFEKREFEEMKSSRFAIVESMHSIENNNGVNVSVSLGFGDEAGSLPESLQFADMAIELALTRGGDQAVIKNRLNFEFFGGRGLEVERRTKVKSRVMANTLKELVRDSSKVYIIGHKYADFDCVGAAAGVCALARKLGVRHAIVMDTENNAAGNLVAELSALPEYRGIFITPQEALARVDGKTLLVVVDSNRPEQLEDMKLLEVCRRVAVIDHHRVAATYIHNAALGFVEPYSSSTSELMSEVLEEVTEKGDLLKEEADALLSGIVLDTKNFTIRTGARTFDAASYLKQSGADTTDVKRMMQSGLEDTLKKYSILRNAEIYRKVAVAVPTEPQPRQMIAQAADELLNIAGVDASIVMAPSEQGGVYASARSIGELNVQIIMETLGGGGNRSAAAVQLIDIPLEDAVEKVYRAIDDYLDK